MGIQVGIFPMKKSQKILCSVSHTWQGHSECSLLKADTQAVSQLASSLQSRIHLPRVLLVLFKQASKLSSFESSLNTNFLHLLMFLTYITEANWVVASLAVINAISMTWTSWINEINSKFDLYTSTVDLQKCTYSHRKYPKRDYIPQDNQWSYRSIHIVDIRRRILTCIPNSSHNHWKGS